MATRKAQPLLQEVTPPPAFIPTQGSHHHGAPGVDCPGRTCQGCNEQLPSLSGSAKKRVAFPLRPELRVLCSVQSLGDPGPFSRGSTSSQGASASPSASGWYMERERASARGCGGLAGAGLGVLEPIPARVFWPQADPRGVAAPTALPRASHRRREFIRQTTDGRRAQGRA